MAVFALTNPDGERSLTDVSEQEPAVVALPATAVRVTRWAVAAVLGFCGTLTAWWAASSAANALPGVVPLDVAPWSVPVISAATVVMVACVLLVVGGPQVVVVELRVAAALLVRVLGLAPRGHRGSLVLAGLGAGLVALGLGLLLVQVPALASSNVDDARFAAVAGANPAIAGLYMALHGAVSEELIYRGPVLVVAWLATRTRPALRWPITVAAIVLSAAVFGAAHLGWSLGNAVTAAAGGLVYGAVAVARRSLWPAVLAHATYNVLIGAL